MRVFVIFGDIEFTDARGKVALVHRVNHADFVEEQAIEQVARLYDNCDYIEPHYFDGEIIFAKYHKEK